MAWTAAKPESTDKLATSQPHILGNFTQLNTALGLEHARMTDATAARAGQHKFRVGTSTTQSNITSGVPLTGSTFIRTDVSLGARWDYWDGSAWAALGVDDSTQTIAGTKTFSSAAVFTDTVTLGIDPTAALEAVTKQYADRISQQQTLVVSTSNLTLSGEQTIDGTLTSADTILVAGQTDNTENGLYTTAAGAWSRLTGFDTTDTVQPGLLVSVKDGTSNKNTLWHLQYDGSNKTITPGTDAQVFTLILGDEFESTDITLSTSAVSTQAHGLGAIPRNLYAVLVCKTTDLNWAVDDEIDGSRVEYRDVSNLAHMPFTIGADATNVDFVQSSVSSGNVHVNNKTTGASTAITAASWKWKFRAKRV